MSKQVLVAFGSDGTAGDSSFGPESYADYQEGMTFEQARESFFAGIMKSWECEDLDLQTFIEEEFCDDVVGFWVIDSKMHKVINNVDADWGNDSAVYAGVSTMKGQISAGADFVLEA